MPHCTAWLLALADVAGASARSAEIIPLADVKPGMTGKGRTVFEGSRVEEFEVRVIGVLENALGPKQGLILGRLEGGPLEKTGRGMSGSRLHRRQASEAVAYNSRQGDHRRHHPQRMIKATASSARGPPLSGRARRARGRPRPSP
jgi:hypothetical protein